MSALKEIVVNINDTTGLNLTFNQLGIKEHVIPDRFACANINVMIQDIGALQLGIISIFMYFTSLIAHELGHIFALRHYLKKENVTCKFGIVDNKSKMWTGTEWQYNLLEPKQKINVYALGIICGLIPIFMGAVIEPFLLVFLIPYGIGCKTDIRLIRICLYGVEKVDEQNNNIKQWFKGLFERKIKKGNR